MNAFQLIEKIHASEAKIAKKQESIARAEARAEKMAAKLTAEYGCLPENVGFYDNLYSAWDSYRRALQTKETALKAIEKMEKTLADYRMRLENLEAMEKQLPESFRDLREQLIILWDEWDIHEQRARKEEYRKIGREDFLKKYSYAKYRWVWDSTKDSIHKDNERAAQTLVTDLYARVVDRTGTPKGWDRITLGQSEAGPVLNGIVEGETGNVRVESILAGGYNIQKLHVRVLVKKI